MTKTLNGAERYFAVVGYATLLLLWWTTLQFVIQIYYNVMSTGASFLYLAVSVTLFGVAAIGSLFYLNEGAKKNVALGIAKGVVVSLLAGILAFVILHLSGTVMT